MSIAAAFSSLLTAYQRLSGTSPVLEYNGQTVQILPSMGPVDPMFFDGGTGQGGTITVQTLRSAWSAIPVKLETVVLADHDTHSGGTYQVLDTQYREGTVTFTLGNIDTNA